MPLLVGRHAAHIKTAWSSVRDSLWFLPTLFSVAAVALALGLTYLERTGGLPHSDNDSLLLGGVDGTRGVLTAIASGMITVTGVVFSVTIVALQLASSQFTPRILRNFTADRGNQIVLGVFIATFTYTLMVLRAIRAEDSSGPAFVPHIAAGVALLLFLISVGLFIYFINHSAQSIQVSAILDRVSHRTLKGIEHLFPSEVGAPEADAMARPQGEAQEVRAGHSGYLQRVQADELFRIGEAQDLVIVMARRIGDFIHTDQVLASAWPAPLQPEVASDIGELFVLGGARTPDQDVELGIIEISDIAVRALSPGINDPRTAAQCIDRLVEVLLALAKRSAPAAQRSAQGRVHFHAKHLTLADAISSAFGQITHFGAGNPLIRAKLIDSLALLRAGIPARRLATVHSALQAINEQIQSDA